MSEQHQLISEQHFTEFINAIKTNTYLQVEHYLRSFPPSILNKLDTQFRQPPLYFSALVPGDDQAAELMKLLIRNGANPMFKDNHEQSVLFYICREGKDKCAEILLSHGLSLDQVDVYGQTPIFYAVGENRFELVRKYSTKQRVNHVDKLAHQTPLFYAARHGHLEMCKILIEKGADPTHCDSSNKTAAEYAKKAKFPQVAQYLNSEIKKVKQTLKGNPNSQSLQQSNVQKRRKNNDCFKDAKQSYRLVFLNEKGEQQDLSVEEVTKLLQQRPQLQAFLANPQTIPQQQVETWDKVAAKILTLCCKFKGAFYFMQPVDPVKLNIMDYFDIVTNPMDLGTVKRKLSHNCYANAEQFIQDMNLIWTNSYKYNGQNNMVSKFARDLQNNFNKTMIAQGLNRYFKQE